MTEPIGSHRGLLARVFPEKTITFRSHERFGHVRLSPRLQSVAVCAFTAMLIWTAAATGFVALHAFDRTSDRTEVAEVAAAYEARIAALQAERDQLANEKDSAARRSADALAELEARHAELASAIASERALTASLAAKRARIDTLSEESESARKAQEEAEARLASAEKALRLIETDRDELAATLDRIAGALDTTVEARDDAQALAQETEADLALQRDRQTRILARIEDAASRSIGSLEKVLHGAGVNVERIIEQLRGETDGSGGPFVPATEEMGAIEETEADARVRDVMSDLERVELLKVAVARMPFAIPVRAPRFTSGFGVRTDPINRRGAMHTGLDMAGARGTPIYAPADGVVVFSGVQHGYGRMIKIRHDFGFETVYAHLSRARVEVGQRVSKGARIADMGNSGRSTGTHLHYEIRINGNPVNPRKFIEAARNVL